MYYKNELMDGDYTVNYFKSFFNGKNVLVTGHTGFKGSWLSIWLNELGANVIGYSLDPEDVNGNFSLSLIKNNIVDLRGDIRDADLLNSAFKAYKPEIVFHLAAQPIVRTSYEQAKYTFDVNVMGTANVLEAIKATDETKVGVFVTSDKCYQNNEWVWGYRENDRLGGVDPYSCSKACAELVIDSYRNSFFNIKRYSNHVKAIATVRAGNVIGGGDWSKDRIIPDSIRLLEEGKEIEVRNPNAVRPWQHVLEPLKGYMLVAKKLSKGGIKYSGAWNFGPESDSVIAVSEMVEKVIKYWGEGSWKHLNTGQRLHEATLLSLDASKARQLLGWAPSWDVEKAVEKTVEWYKNYRSSNIYELCVKQINEFTSSN
jgi:CDP-glucose 4,6-dehydratase